MSPEEHVYYAHRHLGKHGGVVYFYASPRRWWVELHGPGEVVTLTIRERRPDDPPPPPQGPDYYGWLKTGEDHFSMIQPSKAQLEICFPYGPESDERRGRGRMVHLYVQETT